MRKLIIKIVSFTAILLLWFSPGRAQELGAELFFNNDPGFGNGIAFDPQSNESVDMVISQAAEILEPGKHAVFVRIRENSLWSHYSFVGNVVVQEIFQPTLVAGEYFFNTDPAAGSGNPLSLDASDSIDLEVAANTAGLTDGRHYLYFRLGSGSVWSHYRQMSFMVKSTESIPLNGAEFFINEDPGQGAATASAIEPGDEIDLTLELTPESMEPGRQFLHFRVRNGHLWSHYMQFPFNATRSDETIAPLASLQFFINESDEEVHSWSTELLGESADTLDGNFGFSANGLPAGVHELYLRITDSNHFVSHYVPVEFVVCESIHPLIETDGAMLTCLADETPDAWQWLLNGDTIPGATGATFIALQSGIYSVVVYYNGNCFDESAPIEVIVIEACEPINVNIEVTGNILLTITDFQPEAWQWLLNGDTIPGATGSSFMALQSGMYNVIVYYDGNCVEVSNPIEFTVIDECEPIKVSIEISENTLTAATDFETHAYQWLLNSDTIPGASGAEYMPVESGMYSVVVYYGNECVEVSQPVEYIPPPIANNISNGFAFNSKVQFPYDNFSLNFLFNTSPLQSSMDFSNLFVFNTSPLQSEWAASNLFLFNTLINSFLVTLSVDPPSSGDVTGSGAFVRNSRVTVAFRPATGYEFVNWTDGNGREVSILNPYSFTISDRNISLVAKARLITSAQNVDTNHWKVYPNPASERVNIESTEVIKQIRIMDITGRVWYSEKPNDYSLIINTENLSNGVYIIYIETEVGFRTEKVVIHQHIYH